MSRPVFTHLSQGLTRILPFTGTYSFITCVIRDKVLFYHALKKLRGVLIGEMVTMFVYEVLETNFSSLAIEV